MQLENTDQLHIYGVNADELHSFQCLKIAASKDPALGELLFKKTMVDTMHLNSKG